MKASTIFHFILGLFIIPFFVFCLALPPQLAQAQDSGSMEDSEKYSREELTQMLAPIALYPDAVLSQILMASTYPIEIVEADRWLKKNPDLMGRPLDTALLDKNWSPSVTAICHFPPILALMSERITETTKLGNAFLAQEAEVMDMIQELRAKAHAQGNLSTTSQHKVITEKETIIIVPADPKVIYVPYYDPFYIYGPWWYPAYPPYYWRPSGVTIRRGISYWPGMYFGFDFGTWSYFDWHRRYIYIDAHNRPIFVRQDRWISQPGRWRHVPQGFPKHQEGDRNQRDGDRTNIDQGRREDIQTKIDRDRHERERAEQERERIERELKEQRAKIDRDRQERERAEQARERTERNLKEQRGNINRDRQEQERAEQARERLERDQKEQRAKIDRDRQEQELAELKKKEREKAALDEQERERLERSKTGQSDNAGRGNRDDRDHSRR
ncbi:MAG: DUF3300 domain-containing protein [Pseudomonadota bacterium]